MRGPSTSAERASDMGRSSAASRGGWASPQDTLPRPPPCESFAKGARSPTGARDADACSGESAPSGARGTVLPASGRDGLPAFNECEVRSSRCFVRGGAAFRTTENVAPRTSH